jgi:hypothetical protein
VFVVISSIFGESLPFPFPYFVLFLFIYSCIETNVLFQMSYAMCQYRFFVCPIEYSEAMSSMSMDCEPSALFRPQEYTLPEFLSGVLHVVCHTFVNCLVFQL